MLRLLDAHWKKMDKGCDCEGYKENPQVIIVNEILDSLVFNVKDNKILDIVCDRLTKIVRLRCHWCGKTLFKERGRYE